MKKGTPFIVLAFWTASVLMIGAPLQAATPSPSDCPSCSSFGVQRPPVKKEAPAFSLRNLNGSTTSLSALRGKPVLLFFWGTWCESCKEDIVFLEKLAAQKQDQISVLSIVVDGEREKRVRQIVQKIKITLPVLLVVKEDVIDTYEVRMVPMAVVVDSQGLMVGKIIGQRDWTKPEAWSAIKEICGLP